MSDMQVVTSRENSHAKRLDSLLRQRKAREESGLFVLEGVRLCLDSMSAGLRPQSVYLTPSALQRHPELAAMVWASPQTVWLDETLAARLGDTKTPQGVFAILETPRPGPPRLSPDVRCLILHQIRDPGNLGGILRTAAALGAHAVFLCECTELYSPKTLRASMGGVWRVPITQIDDAAGHISALRAAGIETYAAALTDTAHPPACLREGGGKAILIGNEADGLPQSLIAACTGALSIPMRGGVESLNASAAAAILLWEMLG